MCVSRGLKDFAINLKLLFKKKSSKKMEPKTNFKKLIVMLFSLYRNANNL